MKLIILIGINILLFLQPEIVYAQSNCKSSGTNNKTKIEVYKGFDKIKSVRQINFGYIDDKGGRYRVSLNKKQEFIINVDSDSIVFFIETHFFNYNTDKIATNFLKGGGSIIWGVIPNYDSTKKVFDADETLQLKLMNKDEILYSLLSRESIYKLSNQKHLVFVAVKQKSYETGGVYYKFDFIH
ncbi:MAG TPA: hypothetical protein VD794_10875 [Flavisolibacter sp.]|nr:hypothetical protein [Flavisolibacter sp.]